MDTTEIEKLAHLARLELSREEIEALASDIGSILAYVSEIQSVPVPNCTSEPGAHRDVTRVDGTPHETGMYTDALIQNAPSSERGFVKVKRIIGNE